jgi:KaiC/GvpD/RAD55 family RecA-like ATPase
MPGAVGKRLPLPWRGLSDVVKMHTKEVVIVAGAPGGGKSTFSVNLAMNVDYPVLYLAQDTPASVIGRMTALATGVDVTTAQRNLRQRDMLEEISIKLEAARPHLILERKPVSVERLKHLVEALTEWLGEAPPLIIIDNLIDLLVPGSTHGEMQFYTTAIPQIKHIANEYGTCIMMLHHVTRSGDSRESGRGTAPLKMNDLLFAGEREARHVWGVYNNGEDTMNVQILKQQDGAADPDGNIEVPLRWYPSLGKLTELE